MDRADPRTRYDDLIVETDRRAVDADAFDELRETEVFRSGWGVGAFAFDASGRVLVIDNREYPTTWSLPAGAAEPDESLSAAVVREVAEETGVDVEPVRPVAVEESVAVHDGRSIGMTFVSFLARAETTAVADDLGTDEEQIERTRWVDELPTDIYRPDVTRRAYERAVALDRTVASGP